MKFALQHLPESNSVCIVLEHLGKCGGWNLERLQDFLNTQFGSLLGRTSLTSVSKDSPCDFDQTEWIRRAGWRDPCYFKVMYDEGALDENEAMIIFFNNLQQEIRTMLNIIFQDRLEEIDSPLKTEKETRSPQAFSKFWHAMRRLLRQ